LGAEEEAEVDRGSGWKWRQSWREKDRRVFWMRKADWEKVLSWEMADGGRGGKSDGDGEEDGGGSRRKE